MAVCFTVVEVVNECMNRFNISNIFLATIKMHFFLLAKQTDECVVLLQISRWDLLLRAMVLCMVFLEATSFRSSHIPFFWFLLAFSRAFRNSHELSRRDTNVLCFFNSKFFEEDFWLHSKLERCRLKFFTLCNFCSLVLIDDAVELKNDFFYPNFLSIQMITLFARFFASQKQMPVLNLEEYRKHWLPSFCFCGWNLLLIINPNKQNESPKHTAILYSPKFLVHCCSPIPTS